MPQRAASPPLAHGREGTVYLVLDDFGALGSAFRETDAAQADLTTVVADLLSGQYRHPLRVVAFNTAAVGRATSAQTSRVGFSLVRVSCSMNCQLRCAISWSGRVGESPPSLKGSARPHARSTMIRPLCAWLLARDHYRSDVRQV